MQNWNWWYKKIYNSKLALFSLSLNHFWLWKMIKLPFDTDVHNNYDLNVQTHHSNISSMFKWMKKKKHTTILTYKQGKWIKSSSTKEWKQNQQRQIITSTWFSSATRTQTLSRTSARLNFKHQNKTKKIGLNDFLNDIDECEKKVKVIRNNFKMHLYIDDAK